MSDYRLYAEVVLVKARPVTKDGKEGYEVVHSDGYDSFIPSETFARKYVDVSGQEAGLLAGGPQTFK